MSAEYRPLHSPECIPHRFVEAWNARDPDGIAELFGWRCAAAQNTDVVPGMETNVIDERGHLRAVDYRGND